MRSATKRRTRASCGAATTTMTSRSSGGSKDLTVASGHGVRAETGTMATPIPAAASRAAVRGLPVLSAGRGSMTSRSAANRSTHAAMPLSWS
jgi:hypothetical protein